MKFINLGNKHLEYDFFEDTLPSSDEGKPWKIPSYIDTAKKHSMQNVSKNPLQRYK